MLIDTSIVLSTISDTYIKNLYKKVYAYSLILKNEIEKREKIQYDLKIAEETITYTKLYENEIQEIKNRINELKNESINDEMNKKLEHLEFCIRFVEPRYLPSYVPEFFNHLDPQVF